MENEDTVAITGYMPGRLIDTIKARLQLRNDAALSRYLEVGAPLISKMRSRRCGLSAGFLIRAHEACGLEIGEMRRLCGDRRKGFRIEKLRKDERAHTNASQKTVFSILTAQING